MGVFLGELEFSWESLSDGKRGMCQGHIPKIDGRFHCVSTIHAHSHDDECKGSTFPNIFIHRKIFFLSFVCVFFGYYSSRSQAPTELSESNTLYN